MYKLKLDAVMALFCFTFHSGLLGQPFYKEPLIDIPGNNYDFDLFSQGYFPGAESYITWINHNNSIYAVYIKKISPEFGENILIASDSVFKSRPKIAYGQIVWQNQINNYYQIMRRNYSDDSLQTATIFRDSLISDPQISLSMYRLAWIENGKLFVKKTETDTANSSCIDSSNCSSPSIMKQDYLSGTQILYVKEENGNYPVYLANHIYYPPHWRYNIVSEGENRTLEFGTLPGLAFEHFDGLWKIKYSYNGGTDYLQTTTNNNCNYYHPDVFSYRIASGSSESHTPFFLTFDSDSLANNHEIYMKMDWYGTTEGIINISNMSGNDYHPRVAYINMHDTTYVSIIWIHEDSSKSDIWMAKEIFNPIIGAVENGTSKVQSYQLLQNYPNPFNPTTNIEYYIEKTARVSLQIVDVTGRKVMTLRDGIEKPGIHTIRFDGHHLTSGTYFYILKINGKTVTRSMTLMR